MTLKYSLLLVITAYLIEGYFGGRDCCIWIWKGTGPLIDLDDYSNSDPYVRMYGKYDNEDEYHHEFTSQTVWNDETPEWNEYNNKYCIDSIKYDYLYFQVIDEDVTTGPDFMGDTDYNDVEIDELPCDSDWNEIELKLDADGDDEQGSLWIKTQCYCG